MQIENVRFYFISNDFIIISINEDNNFAISFT